MATIQYSALVSGIQGKLNGSILSKGRSGQVLYQKGSPRQEPTSAQLRIRQGFLSSARTWRMLTPEQRADWQTISDANPQTNKFGETWTMPGYQYYKRFQQLAFPRGTANPTNPNLADQPAYEFETGVIGGEWSLTDAGYFLANVIGTGTSINDSPVPNLSNLYISLPVSDPTAPYFRTWYLLSQQIRSGNLGVSYEFFFEAYDVTMSSGWFTFEGAQHLFKAVFFVPDQGKIGVPQIWSGVLEEIPPVSFPDFTLAVEDGLSAYWLPASGFPFFGLYWQPVIPQPIYLSYTIVFQWAPAVPAQTPPSEGDWGDLITVGITSTGSPNYISPAVPAGSEIWKPSYDAEFPASANPPAGYWIPVRARLRDIATSLEGDWVLGFAPVPEF